MKDGNFGKIRELTRRIPPWIVLVAVFLLGFLLRGGGDKPATEHADHQVSANDEAKVTVWTCAMHPQVRQPEPGNCPICGMELIPATDSGADDNLGLRQIRLSKTARELAEIRTSIAEHRRINHKMRLPGRVTYDETSVEHITAWVSGRIDKLFVDYTGMNVSRGQRIAELYSPELYSAQEELLQAIQGEKQFSGSSLASIRNTAGSTVDAARRKLELYGMSSDQIQAVIDRGEPVTHTVIRSSLNGTVVDKQAMVGMYVKTGSTLYRISNLNTVWVKLKAYEQDIQWLKKGQKVTFTTPAFPGTDFEGKIDFIDPVLDNKSRTVNVRVVAPNPDGKLKPDMLTTAIVEYHSDTDTETPLMIPATAPLITGKRALVYVRAPGDDSIFEGREVVLGPRAEDYYIVREGLKAGDEVVTNGAFKIDAAVQIAAKPSMMNPEESAFSSGMAGHTAMDMKESGSTPAVHGSTKLPTVFSDGLIKLYQAYFGTQDALAADNYEQALKAGDRFNKILLTGLNMSVLNSAQHESWMRFQSKMLKATKELIGSPDIAALRLSFSKLSPVLTDVVRTFGGYGTSPVVLFHCPMAFENKGAEWLQNSFQTRNPYYGSMMLGCHDTVDTLYTVEGKGN